jgi:hypothetical protein
LARHERIGATQSISRAGAAHHTPAPIPVSVKTPLILMTAITLMVVVLVRPWAARTTTTVSSVDQKDSALPGAIVADTPPSKARESFANRRQNEPPIGEFMFLFDVSGSAHTRLPTDPFAQGAALLIPAINALRQLDEVMPERHRVGTVGATSLMQQPLCDIAVPRSTIFTRTDTLALSKQVVDCDLRVRSAPVERYTDIRGALHYAALSIGGARSALRGIVLVSDLVEDPPPGQGNATPNLSGVCVAVYTLMTETGAHNPDLVATREQEWRSRLSSWHARGVQVQSILGFEPSALGDFFRSCEGK